MLTGSLGMAGGKGLGIRRIPLSAFFCDKFDTKNCYCSIFC
ncbi:hypothetical protein SAMN05421548_11850 [Paraburkholderia lycopersici]|uniref:Uncharacterized protein n=1 Tax=Paraburkholderia lycopersici TaxID=416944 RepID=A0A1G6U298_9BURK|nr:hypothetical protein SAMN05421548_11850 [Paraburkholderia lycopersici]